MMLTRIAFVGAGPTTIYTLKALLEHAPPHVAITIFEEQAVAGRGTPYRPGWNDPAMLSNIASIELPPIAETLVAWLSRQPPERLRALGADPDAIDERAFYPRLALGEYFHDQFDALVDTADRLGIALDVRTTCRVADIAAADDALIVHSEAGRGDPAEERFDHVVIATGHEWPDDPEVRPGYFVSPWPASALSRIKGGAVGIRGSSLTAIDAAVAVAVDHGAFTDIDGGLRYVASRPGDDLHLTMMSRKGLLPEADFYHPIPYEPLSVFTPDAIAALIEDGDGLLDRTFDLFKRELAAADPDYAARKHLDTLKLEDFCEGYFDDRSDSDPFGWARKNLAEAKRNFDDHITIPWRYAILRMHEVVEAIVPHLDQAEFKRFSAHFKPIFVDDYATVPHESIERLLALHDAGRLDVIAIGSEYRLDTHGAEGGATLVVDGERRHFPAFVEATGQRPLSASEFPFRTLRDQGIVRDVPSPDPKRHSRGIAIDDCYRPVTDRLTPGRLYCLGVPFLLGKHPFSQGITSAHDIGEIVGADLAAILRATHAEGAAEESAQ